MSNTINDIPEDVYRVVKTSFHSTELVQDCANSVEAFTLAAERNRSIGADDVLRHPVLVFQAGGVLLYGPADLCCELI